MENETQQFFTKLGSQTRLITRFYDIIVSNYNLKNFFVDELRQFRGGQRKFTFWKIYL